MGCEIEVEMQVKYLFWKIKSKNIYDIQWELITTEKILSVAYPPATWQASVCHSVAYTY
jgi:hypothetical protein